ncbi:hypothetical protein ABET51_06795 [Metabacillus fastidiosus]|uniref:hypothetical protein n=1 Tax=Metabacillus fastidiosus TaxID=1458 RepID=UPI003D2C645A
MEYKEFIKAGEEFDTFINEGYFGDKLKSFISKRDNISLAEYYYLSIMSFIKNTSENEISEIGKYVESFFYLYTDAIKVNGQAVADILTDFMRGNKENPESENQSSFNEFAIAHRDFVRKFNELKGQTDIKNYEKKECANLLIKSYSKGIELAGKILIPCILITDIHKNKNYSPYKIYSMTLFNKIELFNSLTEEKYKILTDAINRKIRNAEAHLSINFDINTDCFVLKLPKKDKIELESISYSEMLTDFYPKVGRLIQSFLFSCQLYYLVNIDLGKYREITNILLK